ncbi:MAG: DUF4097 family beta strand repeat-containing protein [Terracidiphilus sp.]|jgi:DUF4097 and DUF4098 domain-containing protein YvlB
MSSNPPVTPPGGAPPPFSPYDGKAQYRAYREQQKAAWRAQKQAWKAGAGYPGPYIPRVPSMVGPVILIVAGVIGLMVSTGHIAAAGFWAWYGKWWPLLLIAAGLALLGEWAIDLRREIPVRRSGGYIGVLILLAIVGVGATGWNHMLPWVNQWNNENGWAWNHDLFNAFGLPEHDNDAQTQSRQIPANASILIENPRGDVSITSGEESSIEVQAHEAAYASTDSDAKKIFDSEAPYLQVTGNSVLVDTKGDDNGRVDLTVTVPHGARVTVTAGKGDVTASGLGAGINVTAHGDVHLSAVGGPVQAHFSNGKHDFSVHDLQGDLQVDGDLNDLTVSEIKGKVAQSGEILGDVHLENVTGSIHLHTSVTDVQLASLPGDLTLNSDDLRVNEATGQVRVTTHSKDIDLSEIYGDSTVEDRDGSISVEPAGNFAVDAKNSKGDVDVSLPPNASASVNARTRNGDIVSEYAMPRIGEGENKMVNFQVGSGAAKIVLSADNGDVHIKKGDGFPEKPPAPQSQAEPPAILNVPPNHRVPELSNAPHLKAHKELPAQPVTQ